jgi:hypothetical protein
MHSALLLRSAQGMHLRCRVAVQPRRQIESGAPSPFTALARTERPLAAPELVRSGEARGAQSPLLPPRSMPEPNGHLLRKSAAISANVTMRTPECAIIWSMSRSSSISTCGLPAEYRVNKLHSRDCDKPNRTDPSRFPQDCARSPSRDCWEKL